MIPKAIEKERIVAFYYAGMADQQPSLNHQSLIVLDLCAFARKNAQPNNA